MTGGLESPLHGHGSEIRATTPESVAARIDILRVPTLHCWHDKNPDPVAGTAFPAFEEDRRSAGLVASGAYSAGDGDLRPDVSGSR